MEAIEHPNIAVVIVPFPAQGHLNQLLHLSRLLSAYNLPIHVITTTTHGRQAKTRIHGWNPLSIHFHHHPTHFHSPPPDPTAAVKFPDHLIPSFKSAMHLRQPFVDLLSTLSPAVKRVVVIHDYLMNAVVQDVVSYANVESYSFTCCSAFAAFWYTWEATGLPTLDGDGELPEIVKELPSNEDCMSKDGLEFIFSIDVPNFKRFSSGKILDACRVIEGKYIDLLEQEESKNDQKIWALGPFNPVSITSQSNNKQELSQSNNLLFDLPDKQEPKSVLDPSNSDSITSQSKNKLFDQLDQQEPSQSYNKLFDRPDKQEPKSVLGPINPDSITGQSNNKLFDCLDKQEPSQSNNKLFDWLDKQEPNSVLYISFGTTTSMSNEQIQELALGLEKSDQRFIWVLRDADKGDIFDGKMVRKIELPEGFEKRVGENGLMVGDWVAQPEILGHPATGGFMSHCGWNSSMESMTMGVPVAAWPMHSDQPRNAMLITKVLKVGMYVRDWTQREELVSSAVVEEVVRRLMASEEGEEMRKRAAELGGSVRRSMEDGGVTRMELDSFVAHISR